MTHLSLGLRRTGVLLIAALAVQHPAPAHAALRRDTVTSVPEQECDRLAQPLRNVMGQQAITDGVDRASLRGPAAVAACAQAMQEYPAEKRFPTYAGRAAEKVGNYTEAARLYKIGADAGSPVAQNNLGTLYELGQGVPRDLREAARLYRLASDQDYQISRANLGAMYSTGRGVQRDDREAVRLMQLAADDMEPNGLNNLGTMYAAGRGGLARDLDQAVRLWRQAAELGSETARGNLRKAGRR